MALRSPPLLEPYLRLPDETSLILLSGVLGSSTNWLVHRYLASLLAARPSALFSPSCGRQDEPVEPAGAGAGAELQPHVSVVLVSFLRDYVFWKDGSRRVGLDLDVAGKRGSFVFVDGLTGLFMPPPPDHGRRQSATDVAGRRVLLAATTDHLRRTLEDAVAHVQALNPGTQTMLVIDQPDALLAAAGDAMSSQSLRDTILGLREKVHACIVTVSADEPLISAQGTPLEKGHASLALSLTHDAYLVISLRTLDTGTAKDVSGVLRVTPGGDEDMGSTSIEDRELLYFIRGDGSVRVFERGQ
ncbi:putative protein family [Rosellinia necatrix]|uniref:Elongator complex protein 6 n=1 Tax=Rosellinia necatrix TaxID=77044 RepID=A0A1W2TS49_ROSNE|nr:putative protein family [Rosellinia necatrix]